MAEVEIRDSTIKLFGKTIALSDYSSRCQFNFSESTTVLEIREKETSYEELASEKQGNEITDQTTSGVRENPSIEREISSPKASKNNEEQSETSISPDLDDDKTSKKPDKILPCPRCNSMDTKFCYFNNYNVHQPRHFCKNCQRYWTAGGTMRNVPVGAGRRKNKTSSSSHYRQLIIPDLPHQFLGNNGTFLNFASDSSIPDNPNGDDHSSKSSITASNSSEQPVVKNVLPFPPQLQPFTGLPWPYMAQPGFPVSYYAPLPYWGSCTPPPSWTLINPNPPNSSSVLGKHSRDGEIVKQSHCEEEEVAARSINGGGIFGSFQQSAKGKEEEEGNEIESWSLLQANPAAFSRALKFREIA